jgi:hypothetical protein
MSYTFLEIRNAILAGEEGRSQARFPFGTDWRAAVQKAKISPSMEALTSQIREEAERALVEPIPTLRFSQFHLYEKEGTRLEYERPYFDRRRRLLGLTLAALLDDTGRYLQALEDLIWEICGEYTWSVPAHIPFGLEASLAGSRSVPHVIDLFAAETAHGLAETLYLLEDKLNPWIAYRIRSEIEERTLKSLFDNPVPFHWEYCTHNWGSVCAGAVGMTALLTVRDPDRLAGMMDRIIRTMECYLEGFGEDGGCAEGIGYWTYGFGYYTYFADMLETATAGKLRLLDGEKLRRIAAFPLAITMSENRFVNYSDASDSVTLHTGMVSRLVKRCGVDAPYMDAVPSFHQDHCYRFAHTARNLLWTDPDLLGSPVPEGEDVLSDLQWIMSRIRGNGGLLSFSAKGGHNEEPHNHNDLGHFIVHANGVSLLTDLGAGVYTRDYFGEKRYTFLHNRSLGHSVPVIEGTEQQPGRSSKAAVISQHTDKGHVQWSLDLTQAYPVPHLKQFVRSFDWAKAEQAGARLVLEDRLLFSRQPGSWEEAFITLQEPSLQPGAVHIAAEGAKAVLHYDEALYTAAYEVLPTQAHQGKPVTVYRLTFKPVQPAAEAVFRMTVDLAASGQL